MGRFHGTAVSAALMPISCTTNPRGPPSDPDPSGGAEGGEAGHGDAEAGATALEAGGAACGGIAPSTGGADASEGGVAGADAGGGGAAGEDSVAGGAPGVEAGSGGAAGEDGVTSGAAGAPTLPPVELPEGCAIQSERPVNVGPNGGCSIGIRCSDARSLEVVCVDQEGGLWTCSESGDRQDDLELTGLTGPDVCRFAGKVFAAGADASFKGEESCVPELRSNVGGRCEIRDLCQRTARFEPDIEATLLRRKGVSCSGSPAVCDCYDEERYRVAGLDLAAACERAYELCEEPEPTPDGPTSCDDPWNDTSLGVNECWTTSTCSTSTELEAGIAHIDRFERDINCQGRGSFDMDGSVCYCDTDLGQFTFESALLVEDDSFETCARFHAQCLQPEAFDFQGPNQCEAAPVSVNEPYGCVIGRGCRRPAMLDGEPVVAKTSATLRCYPEGDSFRCACDDAFGDTILLEAPSLEDACIDALKECPEPAFLRPPR